MADEVHGVSAMRKLTLPLACLLILSPSIARAQVQIHIDLGLPVAPPLVVVQPGIQVVEGLPEEVFFHRGWYWCRRPNGWYRARSPRDRFDWIEARRVPGALVRVPPGHYRNWHHEGRGAERREAAHERRDERREERHMEHRPERREERPEPRGRGQEERQHGRGKEEQERGHHDR